MTPESDSSYPRTAQTRHGIPVDTGIVDVIEQSLDLGLITRSSCSGLARDHAPEDNPLPYVSVQIAPTFESARPTTTLPRNYLEAPLRRRLQRVGDRADWIVEDGVSWMLYPTITFRLAPTRGGMKNQLFGRGRDFDDLSNDEELRLDQQYDEAVAEAQSLSDAEITDQWEALRQELTHEFDGEDLPRFADNKDEFEAVQDEWPELFEMLFESDGELLKFYDRSTE